MTRKRGQKIELSESWDGVDSSQDSEIFTRDDERQEMGSFYQSTQSTQSTHPLPSLSRNASSINGDTEEDEPITLRNAKQYRASPEAEPQFVMPASPNALAASNDQSRHTSSQARLRAQTPRMRVNERSVTSDAGALRRRAEAANRQKKQTHSSRSSKTRGKDTNTSAYTVIAPVISWLLDILQIAFTNPILKYGLGIWLTIGLFFLARNFMVHSVQYALTPICRLPIVPWLNLPFCPPTSSPELSGNAEFDKLMQAQNQFQEILESTANGAALPLDMKRSEAGIRDLRQVVQYSSLPSKNELLLEFSGFVETARQASQDLSRFNSHIGNAVDRILTINRWTLQVLEGLVEEQAAQGGIGTFVHNHLNIFSIFQPVPLNRDTLTNQYLLHATAVEDRILSLISEAQVLLGVLDNLDGRLDVIADIATRDGISIEEGKDALFALLWTKLGGNRNSVARLNHQLQLLNEVGTYRKLAWAHVAGTIVKLQAIHSQLEDLRERVATPENVGPKMPLEQQIQNVLLGVERLEDERQANRKSIEEHNSRVFGRNNLLDQRGQLDG